MLSKYFHETRIKELEFKRGARKIKDDRINTALSSLLSVASLFFIFELQKPKKDFKGIIILGSLVIVLLVLVMCPQSICPQRETYQEDKQIQREFDILLERGRKHKPRKKQHKQKI